jgi:ribonuclease HII
LRIDGLPGHGIMKTVQEFSGFIAGVDEVGRGPLAGPVIAAAVILDEANPIAGLADSKTLSATRREELAHLIRERALCWALGRAEVEEIDRINILRASLLAMKRAVEALSLPPELVLIDGNQVPNLHCAVQAIVRGDATVPSISAASIVAKVARDAEMIQMDVLYPGYGFSRHKGYPTEYHLRALEKRGVSQIHRRSFGPVRKLLSPYN